MAISRHELIPFRRRFSALDILISNSVQSGTIRTFEDGLTLDELTISPTSEGVPQPTMTDVPPARDNRKSLTTNPLCFLPW